VRLLSALLALAFGWANVLVGYLFVAMALADKTAHKGLVQQALPLLGGIALAIFALLLILQAVRLIVSRPRLTPQA
jgi:putative Ca2+/H+ antiporter (TMEM165/GDT1 family)